MAAPTNAAKREKKLLPTRSRPHTAQMRSADHVEQCPGSGAKRKTSPRDEYFAGLSNQSVSSSHGYSGQCFPTGSASKRVLVDGYTRLVTDRVQAGWTCDLVTILFSPLTGARGSVISKMKDEVQWIYSTLVTRVHRKPKTAPNDELPVFVGAADLPVYKSDRSAITPVFCNGGLHFHLLVLIPPGSRLEGAACRAPRKEPRSLCWYRDVDPTHPRRTGNERWFASG